jgi:hypothetical protein
LGYGYSDVSYGGTGSFSNYSYTNAYATLSHALKETDSIFATVFTSEFSPQSTPTSSSNTNNYGFTAGYSGTFWETWKASLSGGVNISDSRFTQVDQIALPEINSCLAAGGRVSIASRQLVCVAEEESLDAGLLFDAKLEKRFEAATLSAGYSRSVSPSSTGSQQSTDVISIAGDYRLSETLSSHTGFIYSDVSYQGAGDAGATRSGRTYATVVTSLTWRMSDYWSLIGSYTYSQQALENNADEVAASHAVGLSLSYDGRKLGVSR